MKKIIIALIVAISIGGVMVSCGNTSGKETSSGDSKKVEKQESKVYKIGDIVKVKDKEIVVESVKKSKGSDFEKPQEGNEYLIIKLNIRNVGDDNISYNPLNYKMKNSNGQIKDEAFSIIDKDTALHSGELAPEGKVTGTIVFEAPKGDKGVELLYKDNMFNDKPSATIKLN